MSDEQREPPNGYKVFDLLTSVAIVAHNNGIALDGSALVNTILADAAPRLREALADPTWIQGSRIGRMFEATALTLCAQNAGTPLFGGTLLTRHRVTPFLLTASSSISQKNGEKAGVVQPRSSPLSEILKPSLTAVPFFESVPVGLLYRALNLR